LLCSVDVTLIGDRCPGELAVPSALDRHYANWTEIPRLPLMGATDEPVAARDHTGCLKLFVHAHDNFTYVAEQFAPNAAAWIGWTNI